MSSINLYIRLFTKPRVRPGDDSDCWGFWGFATPPSLPLQHLGRMGHRAVDGRSHVTVWGPQTLGGGCLRRKQALTATLTNNTHSCRKCSYLYQLKPQVTVQRWSTQESKGTDMKKETKQTSFWQHNKWRRAVNFHLSRTPSYCQDVTSAVFFCCRVCPVRAAVMKQWQKVNERRMDIYLQIQFNSQCQVAFL